MANRLAVDGRSPIYWPVRVFWRQGQSRQQQPLDGPFHLVESERSATKLNFSHKIAKLSNLFV